MVRKSMPYQGIARMSEEELQEWIKKHQHSTQKKKGEADRSDHTNLHNCPVCFNSVLVPLGGPGSYWFKCKCGAYSSLCETIEECLDSKWQIYIKAVRKKGKNEE